MNSGDSQASNITPLLQDASITTDDRRSAIAVFEQWQHQWPALFRGEAWLHLERLKKAIADPRTMNR